MKPYTYLLIDFFAIVVCFVASFHPKIKFHKHFATFLKAAIIAAIPFIAWDVWFTSMGVWWFNTDYTIGLTIFNLPIEECLFFFCIPFACVFTFYCLDKLFNLNPLNRFGKIIVWVVILICLVVCVVHHDRVYPFVTFLVTAATVLYLYYVAKVDWIGKVSFTYLVLMPGFFLVNGVLTGTGLDSPIVNYNSTEILNIRMLTIPVEDAFYGYAQFMIVVYLFYRFRKSSGYES